jgi:hypothetical protein
LFAGPRPIVKAYTPIWLGGHCGPGIRVSPTNKILPGKLLFAAPAQFRRVHYEGAQHFESPPGLVPSPDEMRSQGNLEEPMPNFGVMACVGPAAGRRTKTNILIFI